MPWTEISIILSLIFGIPILIRFYVWIKDRRRQSIRNLSDFLDQAILALRANSTYEGFNFPEGFNYWYQISASNRTLNNFSKLRPLLGWKIKRYNIFCNQIDTMIRHFRDNAGEQGIIERVRNSDGRKYVLDYEYEKYSKKQLNVLLKKRGLIGDKESIEKLLRELPNKSQGLLSKFQKLRTKWRGL